MQWRCPAWLYQITLGLGVVLALCVLTVMALVGLGFPQGVTGRLLASLNSGDYFCQVQHLALDWRGGLAAREVQVYRKGELGPPFLQAREVRVLFNIMHPRQTGWGRVKSVTVREGLARPLALAPEVGRHPAEGAGAGGVPVKSMKPVNVILSFEHFDFLGVWVERMTSLIHLDGRGGEAVSLSGTVGREQQRGGIRGECFWTWTEGVHGKVATSFDPHILIPLCRVLDAPAIGRLLEWFSFPSEPPGCDLLFNYTPGQAGALQVTGRVQAANFAYRGAGITFANMEGSYDGRPGCRRMNLDPLVLVVAGRHVDGKVKLDFDASRADFEVVSGIDVPLLAQIVGIEAGSVLDDCRFGRGTRIYARGTVGYADPRCSDMEAVVEGSDIGVGPFVADECSFKFLMKGPTNLLTDVKGKIGGGSFAGSAAFMPEDGEEGRTRYEMKGELFHVDFQALKNLFNTNSTLTTEGRLYGSLDLSGRMGTGQGATATGQGYVTLRRGLVFSLPLFGGMTNLLAKALPGVNFAPRQTEVRIPFEVREGRISSRDIQIEGDVLSLTARGDCTLNGNLAFDVQVRPMKDKTIMGQALRALAYPISRLFEFRLEGTLDKPRWSLFNLSREKRGTDRPQEDGAL
jgi:hypothetical protein